MKRFFEWLFGGKLKNGLTQEEIERAHQAFRDADEREFWG